MTPAAIAAGAVLVMLVTAAALTAHRRKSALRLGDPYPQNIYRGLRWAAALRALAVIVTLVLLTVIGIADPGPLVDRLFTDIDSAGRDYVVDAFHEVMALAGLGVAAAAVLADVVVTFVKADVLRRMLMSTFTLTLAGCTVYGGLFVFALAVS